MKNAFSKLLAEFIRVDAVSETVNVVSSTSPPCCLQMLGFEFASYLDYTINGVRFQKLILGQDPNFPYTMFWEPDISERSKSYAQH